MLRRAALVLLLAFAAGAQGPDGWHVVDSSKQLNRTLALKSGDTIEVAVGLPAPSELPPNGRLAVEWAGYRKVIHALDPDFYIVYRAPQTKTYSLKVSVVEEEDPVFNLPRWRESGSLSKVERFPRKTPWPAGKQVKLRVKVNPVVFGISRRGMIVEAEPNDTIAQAQPIVMGNSGADETLHITGGADDIEYFDNGKIGQAGDDWFRLEYKGTTPRLFTGNLVVPDPFVVAQLLFYTEDGKEYRDGANGNERVHQQNEGHRTAITRLLQPGGVYYLRVEANSPGYDVELRLRKPAPYSDPRQAVRQALYDHMSQVDAWLLNRPRGAAVDRRIRDTGSLLGTGCMSCHTQSGVWGPAGAMRNGYRPENVANFRHLMNVMYESLRPTNFLQDAANNTSLAPYDLGDGPAGTRVAGYNVATLESFLAPRRLHSAQQIRTANFVLQSSDPSGVNAAGPGSNVGQAVVYRFAGEILRLAWTRTNDEKYFAALEDKMRKILTINIKFSDDLSNRIEFVRRTLPQDYVARRGGTDEARNLWTQLQAQIVVDERRLRQIQRLDGSWGFDPGVTEDLGLNWKITNTNVKDIDPAPTALALTALAALGYTDADGTVKRGVEALLRMQDPYGRWNRNALTGFVTTAYSIHALSRLYPVSPESARRSGLEPREGETRSDTVARFRAMAQLGLVPEDTQFLDLVLPGVKHTSPQVRYWAQIALGALHNERGVTAQLEGLGDPVKMVREAARWGMRQTLLDDKGWDFLFPAYERGDDLTREAIAGALVMRADATLTRSSAGFARLAGTLEKMMNRDPHPGVRAWASRAAWNWWVWNPPVRQQLNQAFLTSLQQPEASALVETAKRYQTEALFIVNGQRANGSKEHQYPELSQLFQEISKRLDAAPNPHLIRRLTHVAGTFYNTAGGDGGPGQMGYVTEHSGAMMGKAVLSYWDHAARLQDQDQIKLSVEAAANVIHEPLQKRLLDFSTNGPDHLRTLAATSIADPRLVSLAASQEFIEPLMEQIHRGANEPERRTELVSPLLRLFTRARWNLPGTEEQQRIFFGLLIPRFAAEREKLEENTRQLPQMEKEPPDWYLARALGGVLHNNPDLHNRVLLSMFPQKTDTAMEDMFWLPSVKWLIDYGKPVPEVRSISVATDDLDEVRARAVSLFLKQIVNEKVDRRLRNAALALAASETPLREQPAVRTALQSVAPEYVDQPVPEVVSMTEGWRRNFEYFRRWVSPELVRPNREDELGCLGCHGVPGRVPSMELVPADRSGYMSSKALYQNFKILSERVNENNVEQSKLLRKPLNVQTGREDGHQGGIRFNPNDRGYEILKRWVADVAALKRN
ncbi:MAG: HEAT repeat domain-containing protein [Acidobacteriia bacterium]|nr:HEAT repeat domain-containing protein [Terriglobia bacterium]